MMDLTPMRHRCETCGTVDGHVPPDCPENIAPDDFEIGCDPRSARASIRYIHHINRWGRYRSWPLWFLRRAARRAAGI